jgi:hypothetical protein
MVVIRLAAHDRWRWLPPLFVLWVPRRLRDGHRCSSPLVAAFVQDRNDSGRAWLDSGLWSRHFWSFAQNWRQIVASIGRSYANAIQEWHRAVAAATANRLLGLQSLAVMAIRR